MYWIYCPPDSILRYSNVFCKVKVQTERSPRRSEQRGLSPFKNFTFYLLPLASNLVHAAVALLLLHSIQIAPVNNNNARTISPHSVRVGTSG